MQDEVLRYVVEVPQGLQPGNRFMVQFNEPFRFALPLICPLAEASKGKLLLHVRIPRCVHHKSKENEEEISLKSTSLDASGAATSRCCSNPAKQDKYLGRVFLRRFRDPKNPKIVKDFRGRVQKFEMVPDGRPPWQYLLQYDDGDAEHLERSKVARLRFVDEIIGPIHSSDEIIGPIHSSDDPSEWHMTEILCQEVCSPASNDTTNSSEHCEDDIPNQDNNCKRRRTGLSLYNESMRPDKVLPAINGFSWQVCGNQIQCDLCYRWWQESVVPKRAFTCADQGVKCGTECMICHEILPVRGGGSEGVEKRAQALWAHCSRKCRLKLRQLRGLVLNLEDHIPWRAVYQSDQSLWIKFRQSCAAAATCATLASNLLWLVNQVKREAVNSLQLEQINLLCGQLEQGRAVQGKERSEYQGAMLLAILMFVDEEVINWSRVEELNRQWEKLVFSEKLEQQCNFRYVERSELAHTTSLGSKELAERMRAAEGHSDPPVWCTECRGSGRNPRETDEDCDQCYGLGVVSGDSPFKLQLSRGTPTRLRVAVVNECKGLGVFAEQDIEAGMAVCEYVGELISPQEATVREEQYRRQGLFYLFEPRRLNARMVPWVIDATKAGNVSRFINHACGPAGNLVARQFLGSGRYRWEQQVPLRVALVSSRRIRRGEELLYDYSGRRGDRPPPGQPTPQGTVPCKCGHQTCSGWVL